MGASVAGLSITILVLAGASARAQNPPDTQTASDLQASTDLQAAAERFLEVLLRRPGPGTALDRVYQYFVDQSELKALLGRLDVSGEEPNAGAKQMVRGLLLTRSGDLRAAVVAFEKADAWRSDDAMASFYLANTLLSAGELDQATAAFERAIDRGPARQQAPEVYLAYGKLLARTEKHDRAVEVFQQLGERYPGNASVEERVAAALSEQGQSEPAREAYQRLATRARSDEKRFEFELKIAEIDLRLGNTQVARERLQKMIARVRPGSWLYENVRQQMERSYTETGDFDGLLDHYRAVVKVRPEDLASRSRLARLLAESGDPEQAETVYRQTVNRFPENELTRLALVNLLVQGERWGEAAEELKTLVRQQPDHPDYLMRLGDVQSDNMRLSIETRTANAVASWDSLAKHRADDSVMLVALAKRMDSVGEVQRATQLFKAAMEANTEDAQYRELYGEYLFGQGDRERAIVVWESIASGPRRNAPSLVRLAEVFRAFEMPQRSLETWKQAAGLDLGFSQRLRFVDVLIDEGEISSAEQQLKIASEMVEPGDEFEQLLSKRIEVLSVAGRLGEEIERASGLPDSGENHRWLARLFQANGQLASAAGRIRQAQRELPDSIPILVDAAGIYEVIADYPTAIALIDEAAKKDFRQRTLHLRRLIQLCRKTKELNQALDAARRLVESNPASAESLRLLAEIAIEVGDPDEAESALRRAVQVSPRDSELRRQLAFRLSARFKTEEAIEMYWQLLLLHDDMQESSDVIRELVPLYERRGEFEKLVQRIQSVVVSGWGNPERAILIAHAWDTAGVWGRARSVLDESLRGYPRNMTLLATMVDLCAQNEEPGLAAGYLERLLVLEDSKAGRKRLIQFELKAGLLTALEASLRELENTDDPKAMMEIVRRHCDSDPANAAKLCRQVLQKHPDLWDVKIVLAQLLLVSDGPGQMDDIKEAGRLATEVDQMDMPDGTKGPAGMPTSPVGQYGYRATIRNPPTKVLPQKILGGVVLKSGILPSAITPAQIAPGAMQVLRLGSQKRAPDPAILFPTGVAVSLSTYMRFRGQRAQQRAQLKQGGNRLIRSGSTFFRGRFITPVDFGQARWTAAIVRLMARRQIQLSQGWPLTFRETASQEFASANQGVNEVRQLRESLILNSVINVLDATQVEAPERWSWRIAALDPKGSQWKLHEILNRRAVQIVVARSDKSLSPEPLADYRLEVLADLCRSRLEFAGKPNRKIEEILDDAFFRQSLIAESRLAGVDHPFEGDGWPGDRPVGFVEMALEIQSALDADDMARADRLSAQLLKAARQDRGQFASLVMSIRWLFSTNEKNVNDFVERHRGEVVEAWIAYCSKSSTKRGMLNLNMASLNRNLMQVVIPIDDPENSGPTYEIFQLEVPISRGLMSAQLMRGLVGLLPKVAVVKFGMPSIAFPDGLGEKLAGETDGASGRELRTRKSVAAFFAWWDKRPEDCYAQFKLLADQYPEDVDLQIEAARLAGVNGSADAGFARLQSVSAYDTESKIQVDLAMLALASQSGEKVLVDEILERLLDRPMQLPTRSYLARQLEGLDLRGDRFEELKSRLSGKSKAASTAKQIRSENERRLQMAHDMLDQGDRVTAAEVAYSVINRVGTSVGSGSDLRESALQVLVRAKSLDRLIESVERKSKSSRRSEAFRAELNRLYLLNGQWHKAGKLWDEVIEAQGLTPRQIVQRASSLRGRRQYEECVMLYLRAFRGDPSLWNSNWTVFTDCVAMTSLSEPVYRELRQFPLERLSTKSLISLVGKTAPVQFGEEQLQFVRQLVALHGKNPEYLDQLISVIPVEHRAGIPELRKAMVELATSAEVFDPSSPLWGVHGWDEHGSVYGVLDEIVELLAGDADLAKQFRDAADREQQESGSARALIASLLTAQLQLLNDSARAAAVREVQTVCTEVAASNDTSPSASRVPSSLLWQMGQMVRSIEGLQNPDDVQMRLFKAASSVERSPVDSEGVHPADQLFRLQASTGNIGLARQEWMARLEDVELPKSKGIREDRELRLVEHVVQSLMGIGCHVDAVGLSRHQLSQSSKFYVARPYSRGRNHELQLRRLADESFIKLDESVARQYFELLLAAYRAPGSSPAIFLGTTPLRELNRSSHDCIFEYAASLAKNSEVGRETLRELLETLEEAGPIGDVGNSDAAARLVLASAVRSPVSVDVMLGELLDAWPTAVDLEKSGTGGSDEESRRWSAILVHYHSLTAIERDHGFGEISKMESVIARLREIASAVGAKQHELELARLSHAKDSMDFVLNSVLIQNGNRPLSWAAFRECTKVARYAIDGGMWDVAGKAFLTGLGKGPPEAPKSGKGVAVGGCNVRMPVDFDWCVQWSVMEALDRVTDAAKRPITGHRFDAEQFSEDASVMVPLEQSLRQAVFPADEAVNVYPYSTQPLSQEQDEEWESKSAVYALTHLAEICGTGESLIALARRHVNSSDDLVTVGVMVDVCWVSGAFGELDLALNQLVGSAEGVLPILEGHGASGEIAMPLPPSNALHVTSVANRMIVTLWPLVNDEDLADVPKQKAALLLLRTAELMKSQSDVAKTYRGAIKRLEACCNPLVNKPSVEN